MSLDHFIVIGVLKVCNDKAVRAMTCRCTVVEVVSWRHSFHGDAWETSFPGSITAEYFPFNVYKPENLPPRFIPGDKSHALSSRADDITQDAGNQWNYAGVHRNTYFKGVYVFVVMYILSVGITKNRACLSGCFRRSKALVNERSCGPRNVFSHLLMPYPAWYKVLLSKDWYIVGMYLWMSLGKGRNFGWALKPCWIKVQCETVIIQITSHQVIVAMATFWLFGVQFKQSQFVFRGLISASSYTSYITTEVICSAI